MLIKFSAMPVVPRLHEDLTFWEIAGLWSFVYFIALFPISIRSRADGVSTGLVFSVGGAAVGSALSVALLIRGRDAATLPGVISLPGSWRCAAPTKPKSTRVRALSARDRGSGVQLCVLVLTDAAGDWCCSRLCVNRSVMTSISSSPRLVVGGSRPAALP
jgi:hypothetical protein